MVKGCTRGVGVILPNILHGSFFFRGDVWGEGSLGVVVEAVVIFFARCCLGKIPGGAPFSQLHKGDKQSRTDTPKLANNKQIKATNSRQFRKAKQKGGDGEIREIGPIGEAHRMSVVQYCARVDLHGRRGARNK